MNRLSAAVGNVSYGTITFRKYHYKKLGAGTRQAMKGKLATIQEVNGQNKLDIVSGTQNFAGKLQQMLFIDIRRDCLCTLILKFTLHCRDASSDKTECAKSHRSLLALLFEEG